MAGVTAVSKADPDGYTLLLTPGATLTVLPQLRKVAYDPPKDFAPIARVGDLVTGQPWMLATAATDVVLIDRQRQAWRKAATPATFERLRKMFEDAGIRIDLLCYNMARTIEDDEIDHAFRMARALKVQAISSTSTVAVARRVAPVADKYKNGNRCQFGLPSDRWPAMRR